LSLFREPMLSISTDDVIAQAALLWKMIYSAVHKFCEEHSDWILLKHEEYSRDPINKYRELYSKLGLDFTARVEGEITKTSSSGNPTELSLKKTHSVKMDSAASIKNWRKRLSKDDVNKIRTMTEGVSEFYYSDEDWVR